MIRIALTLFHMHTYYYLRRSFETTLEGSRREWVTIGPATEVTLKLQADAYEVASITIDGTRYTMDAPSTTTFDTIFSTIKKLDKWYLVTTEDYAHESHYELMNYTGPQISHYRH